MSVPCACTRPTPATSVQSNYGYQPGAVANHVQSMPAVAAPAVVGSGANATGQAAQGVAPTGVIDPSLLNQQLVTTLQNLNAIVQQLVAQLQSQQANGAIAGGGPAVAQPQVAQPQVAQPQVSQPAVTYPAATTTGTAPGMTAAYGAMLPTPPPGYVYIPVRLVPQAQPPSAHTATAPAATAPANAAPAASAPAASGGGATAAPANGEAQLRARIAEIARGELGVKEEGGEDRGARIVEYRKKTGRLAPESPQPWCASFVSWVMNMAGAPIYKNGAGDPSTVFLRDWAMKEDRWFNKGVKEPKVGDLIFFKYSTNNSVVNHVAVVEKVEGGKVFTIGGNEQDAVREKSHSLNDSDIVGYISAV